ncbi:conserved Plasmodium protein, unknown function [Plasmodium sp. gorilla clade G2]|uniref:conserved Plasmodium protein, unknown function n=1 Tax=Plasmodium sp. gorilla clade G2 TaxID=880535 RepID=UPI000D20B363|nr:conserved Plasmodium protein, unknown function [Plasmodium sp. gorilla clade G2]SOV11061.1 conserved Plasmodium protein, unknown function [Plasmodium sp. gorilla clade G2]
MNNNNNSNNSNNNIWKKNNNNNNNNYNNNNYNPNDNNKNLTKNLFFNNIDNEFKNVYGKKNMQGQKKKKNNVAYDTYDNNDNIHASSQYNPFINKIYNNNKYVDNNTLNKKPFHNNTDNKNQGVHYNIYETNEYNKNNFRNKGVNNNSYSYNNNYTNNNLYNNNNNLSLNKIKSTNSNVYKKITNNSKKGHYQNIYTTEDKNKQNFINSESSNYINTDNVYSSNVDYMTNINKNDTRNVYNLYKNHYNNKTKDNTSNKKIVDYSYDNNQTVYNNSKYVSTTTNNITKEDTQNIEEIDNNKNYLYMNEKNDKTYHQNIQNNLNNTHTLYNNYKNVPLERDHINKNNNNNNNNNNKNNNHNNHNNHNNNNSDSVHDILSHCINILSNDKRGIHDMKMFYQKKLREKSNNETIKHVLNKINDITIKYKYDENNINFILKEIYDLQKEFKNNDGVSNFSTYNKIVRSNIYQTNKYVNTNIYDHGYNKNNTEKTNDEIQHMTYNHDNYNDVDFINNNVYKKKDNVLVTNTKTYQGLYKLKNNIQNINIIENKINSDIKKKCENILIYKYYKKHEEYKKKWQEITYKCKQTNVLNLFNQVETKIKDNIKILDIFKLYLFPKNNYIHYKNIFYTNYKMIIIHNVKFIFLQNLFSFHKKIKKDVSKNTQQIIKNNLNKEKEKNDHNDDNNNNNNNNNNYNNNNIYNNNNNCEQNDQESDDFISNINSISLPLPFENFFLFFKNFYSITDNYINNMCLFLIYKIIIMNEDDEEYAKYYNLILNILNKNTLILFLFILISLMKNYNMKNNYLVNLIERILPIIIKPIKNNNTIKKKTYTKNMMKKKKKKKKILFNILYFKLFRLIFEKIETYHIYKKHLLLTFLRYIKNFLLNICSCILITQYIFIKCVDLINKYNNQEYILIKTLSLEIFLQLWNNESVKIFLFKMGKSIMRFLMFISNLEYIHKNILTLLLSSIENNNQIDLKEKLSNLICNNKNNILQTKKIKHYINKFQKSTKKKCFLYISNHKYTNNIKLNMNNFAYKQEVLLEHIHLDLIKTNNTLQYKEEDMSLQNNIKELTNNKNDFPPNFNINNIKNFTLFDFIFQINNYFNYYKILLSHSEKECIHFLMHLNDKTNNNSNNNNNNMYHLNLFFNLYIKDNINNLIHDNKVIYYIDYIKNKDINKHKFLNTHNFFKEAKKIYTLEGWIYDNNSDDLFIHHNYIDDVNPPHDHHNKYINKRKYDNTLLSNNNLKKNKKQNVSDNNDGNINDNCVDNENKMDTIDYNNSDDNIVSYGNEKIIYDLHDIIKMNNSALSNIYCSHIRLSFFFPLLFYKAYYINDLLSSSLYIYSKRFKSFKKENTTKIIKFMNLTYISHICIVKFLIQWLKEIKSIHSNICFIKRENLKKNDKKTESLYFNKPDFFECYKLLEYSLKKDIHMTNVFLNYLNKIILHFYEKKREHIVLSVIITLTIYNFLTFIQKKKKKKEKEKNIQDNNTSYININTVDDNKQVHLNTHQDDYRFIEVLEKLNIKEICNEIQQNCLIGHILKENNFYIDENISFIHVDDIYNYELKNHMKYIPHNINKEMFHLSDFKKHLFKTGIYKKVEVIKILKKNIVNNLYTSEILNYIYYNSLYLLIHLLLNIRFYYNIFHNTYKKSAYYYNKQHVCYITKMQNALSINLKIKTNQMEHFIDHKNLYKKDYNDKDNNKIFYNNHSKISSDSIHSIIIKLEKTSYNNYLKKKLYIKKFYSKLKKGIIKNLKHYELANNINKYIKNVKEDKLFLDTIFKFDNSSFFLFHMSFQFDECISTENMISVQNSYNEQHTKYVVENIKNINNHQLEHYEKINNINNNDNNDNQMLYDQNNSFFMYLFKNIKNVYLFVDQINKMVYNIMHAGLNIYNTIIYSFNMQNLHDTNNLFINFYFYEIATNRCTDIYMCHNIDDNKYYNKYHNKNLYMDTFNKQKNFENHISSLSSNLINTKNSTSNNICVDPNLLCIFNYKDIKEDANKKKNNVLYFNELIDYIICSIIQTTYKKEKIIYWSSFLCNMKNYSIINFHLFFYLCSLLKQINDMINTNNDNNNNNNNNDDDNNDDNNNSNNNSYNKPYDCIHSKVIHIIKKKIKICEDIFILYLYKIGLLLNISIYESFDLLFSVVSIIFNYEFFNFYMEKKIYTLEENNKEHIKTFVTCIQEEIQYFISNYDMSIFIEGIQYISDAIFLNKKIKILIFKSYAFLNTILHILPLSQIITDMKHDHYINKILDQKKKKKKKKNTEHYLQTYYNLFKSDNTNVDISLQSHVEEEQIKNNYINENKNIDDINTNNDPFNYNYILSSDSEKFSESSTDISILEHDIENFKGTHIDEKNLASHMKEQKENKYEETKDDTIKTNVWIFKIFKFFYYRSFMCFYKNKSQDEHLYEKKKCFLYFFFPNKKKKNNKINHISQQIYHLRKMLLKKSNFAFMCKQAYIIKWICLRMFILKKYDYKRFNVIELFQYIYKKLHNINNKEIFEFHLISADNSLNHFDSIDIKYIFNIFLIHINKMINYLTKKYYELCSQQQKCIQFINTKHMSNNENKVFNLYNQINNNIISFIISFYPYLIKNKFSYDIFFKLFNIYFNMYIINKQTNNISLHSSIYLILFIFIKHTNTSVYMMFSYFTSLQNYLQTTNLFPLFDSYCLNYEGAKCHIRESVEYFVEHLNEEFFILDDIKIIFDVNSISLFYHMLINIFS